MKLALVVASLGLFACGSEKKDAGNAPVVPADFAKKHKAAVDVLNAKLAAAADLVKDLPAVSEKKAEPEVPIVLIRQTASEKPENAFIYEAHNIKSLPEYTKYATADTLKGNGGINLAYTDFLDLQSADLMVAGNPPRFSLTGGAADYLGRRIAQMRYVLIAREVNFKEGSIDKAARIFTPGEYEGVTHVVDLNGPKLVGSIAYKARNTGSFESYEGSEAFIFRMDLTGEVIGAFIAEAKKVFPSIDMPARMSN